MSIDANIIKFNNEKIDDFFEIHPQRASSQKIKTCIQNYAALKDNSLSNLIYRIKELILTIVGLSDWQKARQEAVYLWKINPGRICLSTLNTKAAWDDLADEVMQVFISNYFTKEDDYEPKAHDLFNIAEFNLWLKHQYKINKKCVFTFHTPRSDQVETRGKIFH